MQTRIFIESDWNRSAGLWTQWVSIDTGTLQITRRSLFGDRPPRMSFIASASTRSRIAPNERRHSTDGGRTNSNH
jgi:hypothetical protein